MDKEERPAGANYGDVSEMRLNRHGLIGIRRHWMRPFHIGAGLCALTLGVMGTGATAAAAYPSGVTVPASARTAGVAFQTFYDANPQVDFHKIASDGSNSFNITVWWQVPCTNGTNNCTTSTSDTVQPCPPSGGTVAGFPSTCGSGETIGDQQLITLAEQAENAGLRVSITPDFTVGAGGWRGGYDPGQTAGGDAAFFASYQRMVDHYATISQEVNAPMFWVGSEMTDAEKYTADWGSLIASVRQLYTGQVLYDVNWNVINQVKFYNSLDAMSISAYFPLSNDADPTLSQLDAAWQGANPQGQNWAAEIAQAQATWQEPVYFGEVGYSANSYAAQTPYNEPGSGSSDPQLQYRCYEALLNTFRGDPWWGGVFWWSWEGGVYNMVGQPAESLIGTSSVAYPQSGSTGGSSGSNPSTGGSAGSSSSGASSSGTGSRTITGGSSYVGRYSGSTIAPHSGHGGASTGGNETSLPSASGANGASSANGTSNSNSLGGPDGSSTSPGGVTTSSRHGSGSSTTPLIAAGIALLLLVLGGVVLSKRGVFRKSPRQDLNPHSVDPPFDGGETISSSSGTRSAT